MLFKTRGWAVLPAVLIALLLSGGCTGIELLRQHQIAMLAVKCLDTKYGRQNMLGFVDRAVKEQFSYDTSSRSVFSGKPWTTVEAECVTFIRNG